MKSKLLALTVVVLVGGAVAADSPMWDHGRVRQMVQVDHEDRYARSCGIRNDRGLAQNREFAQLVDELDRRGTDHTETSDRFVEYEPVSCEELWHANLDGCIDAITSRGEVLDRNLTLEIHNCVQDRERELNRFFSNFNILLKLRDLRDELVTVPNPFPELDARELWVRDMILDRDDVDRLLGELDRATRFAGIGPVWVAGREVAVGVPEERLAALGLGDAWNAVYVLNGQRITEPEDLIDFLRRVRSEGLTNFDYVKKAGERFYWTSITIR